MSRLVTGSYTATYRYSFADQGGEVGAKKMHGPTIPSGSMVTDAVLVVDTALAGGTGNDGVSVGTGEAASDLQTAAARSGAPWSTTGVRRMAITAISVPVQMTADRQPILTINNTALTGGKVRVILTILEAL